MRMNYQALAFHDQQHPEASLALNAVVMETLISEVFFAYGLLGSRRPQTFATRSHHANCVSKNKFRDMRFAARLEHSKNGGLIEPKLFELIDSIRLARNALMHKGDAVSSRRSLECQQPASRSRPAFLRGLEACSRLSVQNPNFALSVLRGMPVSSASSDELRLGLLFC